MDKTLNDNGIDRRRTNLLRWGDFTFEILKKNKKTVHIN